MSKAHRPIDIKKLLDKAYDARHVSQARIKQLSSTQDFPAQKCKKCDATFSPEVERHRGKVEEAERAFLLIDSLVEDIIVQCF
jgi:hypothetical protein